MVISISLKRLCHWSTIHWLNQSVSSSSQVPDIWSYRPSSGLRGEDVLSPDTHAKEIKLTINDSSFVPTFITNL